MKFLSKLIVFVIFASVFVIVIAYARGYRFDFGKKSMTPTGIISFSSDPQAAKIFVDGQLRGVTNTNMTLPPGDYKIDIKKDGYTSYSKQIVLKGELVASINALLFSLNPTLSPLTNIGLIKAVPVDNTQKIIIFVDKGPDNQSDQKNGIYLFDSSRQSLPFFAPLSTVILKSNLPTDVDFSTASVDISPDAKEAIFNFKNGDTPVSYLLSLTSENTSTFDITDSKAVLLSAWDKQKADDNSKILETFPPDFAKIASDSVNVVSFSPDENKLLYQAKENFSLPPMITPPLIATNQTPEQRNILKDKLYVYDKKEDKNYEITNFTPSVSDTSIDQSVQWYPDSSHLIINQSKKVVVVDYDDTNLRTIYSGPYEKDFLTVTPDGQLITLTNLNPVVNKWPDLYLVGTR